MSIEARTDTAEQRSAIYASLTARNRIVAILRIGLPALGAIIFAGLVLQLFLGSMVPDFGFANVRIDRENLVFEAPSYAGTGSDGTAYELAAESARAGLGNTDIVHLKGASVSMRKRDGAVFAAFAPTAQFSIASQVVTIGGGMELSSNGGLKGTIEDAVIDVLHETLTAPGGVDLTFGDGTDLRADVMTYDGAAGIWTFSGQVKLRFEETPGESTYPAQGDVAEGAP
jgi:lipopolysaccharide export system protein LptC